MDTVNRLYDDFIYTLKQCGVFLLCENDEEIDYRIFEEFAIGCVSFLHIDALDDLLSHELITVNVYDNCVKIRSLFFSIENDMPELYNVESVRNSKIWYEIMSLCDDTLRMLRK